MRISGQLRSNYLNFEERGRLQAELVESERKMKALQKKVDREPDIVGIQASEYVSGPRLTWSSQDQVLCDSLARFRHAKP
jgi:glutaredoxin-related protein